MAEDPPVAPSTDSGFEVVRKGYEQAQVDAHLRRLDAEVRILTADRDAALDQATQLARELDDSRARADRLRAQVRTLVSPQQSVQGMSERMRSMLRLAEDEVAEMLAKAETEVNKRVRAAEQKATQLVTDAQEEAEAVRERVRAEAEAADTERETHRAQLEADALASREAIAAAEADTAAELARLRAEQEAEHQAAANAIAAAAAAAEQERAQAWAESEARRATVEEDFTIAMNQRRTEALAALRAEQQSTRERTDELRETAAAQAQALLVEAEARARQIVAEAARRIVELKALRGRIAEQLGGTRATLDRTLADLAPLSEEATPAPAEVPAARRTGGDPDQPATDAAATVSRPRPQPTRRSTQPA